MDRVPSAPSGLADALNLIACRSVCRRGRFSVVRAATHLSEGAKYAVKVVENKSLEDEENLEALETEVCARALRDVCLIGRCGRDSAQ